MYQSGMGIHADHVPLENIVLMAKYLVVAEILYVFNLVWSKLSVLLMYYRIFHFPYFKKMAYIIGAFVIAWYDKNLFFSFRIATPLGLLFPLVILHDNYVNTDND